MVVRGGMADKLGRSRFTLMSGTTSVGRYPVAWLLDKEGWRPKVDSLTDNGWR